MANGNYRNTPIPFRAKDGRPMSYVIVSDDGIETTVTRAECLARHADGQPYPLYVDEESGRVFRLPRTEMGELIAKENRDYIWREQKRAERWQHRTGVALDAPATDGGAGFDPAAPDDIQCIVEEAALLETLMTALATILTPDEWDLLAAIYRDGKTERQLAPELRLKEPKSVNKRKHRALEKLRNHPALKAFFE